MPDADSPVVAPLIGGTLSRARSGAASGGLRTRRSSRCWRSRRLRPAHASRYARPRSSRSTVTLVRPPSPVGDAASCVNLRLELAVGRDLERVGDRPNAGGRGVLDHQLQRLLRLFDFESLCRLEQFRCGDFDPGKRPGDGRAQRVLAFRRLASDQSQCEQGRQCCRGTKGSLHRVFLDTRERGRAQLCSRVQTHYRPVLLTTVASCFAEKPRELD